MKTKITRFFDAHPYAFSALTLMILTLAIYGDVVFGPSNIVLSRSDLDIARAFTNHQFTTTQILQGHFPLWNPNAMGGYPWFASFQTLILYPPAWIFFLFPVGKAINVFLAAHVFFMGFAMFCWLKQKGLHPFSCIVAGAILIFSSQVTLQIYSGATIPIATMPWAILLLLAVDNCFVSESRVRWILAGTAFVALQIMAGFPQHVYYTALLIGIYVITKVLFTQTTPWQDRLKVLTSVATMYLFGAIICTVQLWSVFDAATETSRHTNLPFAFAGSHSFPPIHFFTMILPHGFGNMRGVPYWGVNTVWETVFFLGITTLVLALTGLFYSRQKDRFILLGLVFLTILVSLGYYTHFYTFLYNYIPGFGSFRANFRILFQSSIFIAALAAMGLDALLKADKSFFHKIPVYTTAALVLVVTITSISLFLQSIPGKLSWFQQLMFSFSRLEGLRMERDFYRDISVIQAVAYTLCTQLALAGITGIIICLLFIKSATSKRTVYYLGMLAVLEVIIFTAIMRPTFYLDNAFSKSKLTFLTNNPGDLRFVEQRLDNFANGLPTGVSGGDIHGYDSFRFERYEAFMQYSQGMAPTQVPVYVKVNRPSPLFRLLRGKYFFKDGRVSVMPYDALPHLLLVPNWQINPDQDTILPELKKETFNPRHTVILEAPPHFSSPSATRPTMDHVSLVNQSVNWLDIKATTTQNTILLVTDAYAKDWKVFPYADSSQQQYDVMPADYILRGIPLSPGTHHFRLEYAPDAFYRGRNISLIALALYLLAWCGYGAMEWKKRKQRQQSISQDKST